MRPRLHLPDDIAKDGIDWGDDAPAPRRKTAKPKRYTKKQRRTFKQTRAASRARAKQFNAAVKEAWEQERDTKAQAKRIEAQALAGHVPPKKLGKRIAGANRRQEARQRDATVAYLQAATAQALAGRTDKRAASTLGRDSTVGHTKEPTQE